MKRLSLIATIAILFTVTACKTQEDIRREKTVDSLNEQVAQTAKSTANANSRFTALEEQMAKLTGMIEENSHKGQQEAKESATVKERLAALEETNKKQTEYMRALNEKVQEQSKYIEDVTKALTALSEQKEKESEKPAPKKKESKESKESNDEASAEVTVKNGISKYKEKDYSGAEEIFTAIADGKKSKKKDKEAAIHYLGMIKYKSKNFEEAKVYFSKLISENENSSYAPSALLNLARTFSQLKSKDEARQTLELLMEKFPKSKEASEGAKLKGKI
jgi:TolA-binding protein